MKRVFTFLLTSLVFVMSAVVAAPTDLPQMTTDMENPVYYTISNTRSTSGRYLYYAGDEVGLKDADNITQASLFYFTGTAEACYIHNAATTKKVASVNSWTDAGIEWTIGVTPYGDGTTGLCICPKGNTQSGGYWNEFAHNDCYTTWSANDAGSVFVVELYGDVPETPETPVAPQPETGLFYRIKLANQDLYLTIDGYNGTGAIGAHGTTPFLEKSLMNNDQIWTFEATDTEGVFYLKSKSGYYITHDNWNVNAFDNPSTKGLVSFVAHDENTYKIKNVNRGCWYKVEIPSAGSDAPYPFCDASNDIAALFSLELVDSLEFSSETETPEEEELVRGYITELSDVDPTKCYTINTAGRGAWTVSADGTMFSSTGYEGFDIDPTDTRQQFAILSLNAKDYYLYSVSAKKFVKQGRTLVAGIADAIEFIDASVLEEGRVMVYFKDFGASYVNVNNREGLVINSWNTIDSGNAVLIAEADDFDASEALAMLSAGEQMELEALKNQVKGLVVANAGNHSPNPIIGQYLTSAYEALVAVADAENLTKEELEEAIAAFEASKCLPVFTIDGVYRYAAGMSIYENVDGSLLWKETDPTDESMLWVFDMNETVVGVTDKVVVKNLATRNLFWGAAFVQVTETSEGIADDGLFLFYTEGVGYPVHADEGRKSVVRWNDQSANSASAWKFTFVGTTYDILDLPSGGDPADDCTITYEFAHNGQVLYTQESVVALGSVYPDYNITFPFGVTAAAKPEGMVSESKTVEIALTVSLPIEYAESYEEIGDNWHYLTIHATQKNYLYYDPSLDYLDVTKTGVDTTNVDAYAWAFVGNPIEGFKIVNKLAGQDKNLCLGERYAYMGEEAYVFALEGSSHPGGFVIPTGRESLYLNKNNGKLGYWGYLDNGCVFFMTDEMGSITPVVPAPPKVWYDVVVYAGENGTVDGGGNFEEGTRVSVSATPNAGYRFAGWSNGSTANPYEFTVRGAVELTATFEELPHPGEMLIPFGQFTHEPWPVKYFRADMDSDVTPGANWYAPDFDDSSWITAEAPITNVRYKFYTATMWEPLRSTYWVRRTFNLESIPQDRTFVLYVSHDDECTMYLNGHEIFETTGWTETYKAVKMDDEFASYLVEGENVITAVVTNSGLNHACVDFGIYHVEKEAEVIQPKRSVMVYAGAYSRCILEDHVIEPNDSLTLSGAFADGETIRLVFEPLEGYRVLSMKRNGEVVAIHNNVYEERAFEDVMFTDVTYEAPAPKVWYDVVVLAGENGTVDGGGSYEEGTRVSVSATPNAGYRFAGWSNGSNANPYEFTVREAVELTAEFEALPHPGEMLIPFGQFTHEPWPVKYFRADMYSGVAPDTCWYTPDFDDSSWTSAEAPITNVRYKFYTATFWEPLKSTYWVRRTFDLDSIPEGRDFVLYVSHDDECTMYLNGHKIFEATGWTETYKAVAMNDEFASYLVEGENVMTAVVTNSGLNHACVDFGIYHIEKGEEVVQPKRSVMAYAGAYGRCALNDHIIEANDSLTLSSAYEDGDAIRLVFEPFEGYNVVSMKRNGEFVAINNNVYEELAFEDVMFTDVTYEVNVPLEIIGMEPDSVPVAKVDYLTLTFNEEVIFTLPDEGITVTGINTGKEFKITECFIRDRYDGSFNAYMYFKLESREYDVINTPDTYSYTIPAGAIQSIDGDELSETTITFTVIGLFSLESFSPAETTCLDKIELTFDEEIAEAMTPWYELGVYNNYNGEWHFSSAVNNIFVGDDKHVVTLELETPIVEPGEYYFHIPEGLFIAEGGMLNDTASMTFVVVEDSLEVPDTPIVPDTSVVTPFNWSGIYSVKADTISLWNEGFNALEEFTMEVVYDRKDSTYSVTQFLGYDVDDYRGYINLEPLAGEPNKAKIIIEAAYLAYNESTDSYFVLEDPNETRLPLIITRLDDGTFTISDFSVSYLHFGDSITTEYIVASYQAVTAELEISEMPIHFESGDRGWVKGAEWYDEERTIVEYTSPLYRFDEKVEMLRMIVWDTPVGPAYFSLSELEFFDGDGVKIELTEDNVTSNADHNALNPDSPDGGGIAALFDGDVETYFHSAWRNMQYGYPYLVVTLPNGGYDSFSFRMISRAVNGDSVAQTHLFPKDMLMDVPENLQREELEDLLTMTKDKYHLYSFPEVGYYNADLSYLREAIAKVEELLDDYASEDECKAMKAELNAALEHFKTSGDNAIRMPEADKVYRIVSAFPGFYEHQSVEKTITINDSTKALWWEDVDTDNSFQEFVFEPVLDEDGEHLIEIWDIRYSNGTVETETYYPYYMKHVATGLYAGYVGGVGFRFVEEPSVIRLEPLGDGQFNIYGFEYTETGLIYIHSAHAGDHNGGFPSNGVFGMSSAIVPYNGGYNTPSAWYIREYIEFPYTAAVIEGESEFVRFEATNSLTLAADKECSFDGLALYDRYGNEIAIDTLIVSGNTATIAQAKNLVACSFAFNNVEGVSSVILNTLGAPEDEGMLGDVNGDGYYTMADVVMMVNAVLEKPQANFNANVADMNGDGAITMSDVVSVLRLVLTDGESIAMAAVRRVQRSAVMLPELRALDFAATNDGRVVLPVALNNSEAYSAFQLDLVLPAGVEFSEATLTDRAKATHAVAWNTLADGSVRIVAYALDNAVFRGNEGELLNLVLNTTGEQCVDAEAVLADGLFATVEGVEHRAANVNVMMRGTTDIDGAYASSFHTYSVEDGVAVECGADTVVSIYVATGQLVKHMVVAKGKSIITLPAGIYMVNGNKVIVK